jgi:potassium/hydrogen antiporter
LTIVMRGLKPRMRQRLRDSAASRTSRPVDTRRESVGWIDRFHDGLAWLAQMAMFLMLGLLVTPSNLMPTLLPAVGIAVFLVLVARPVAVVACLLPFRFSWREQAFVAWVGLRGAVAIFLGTIPILAGVEHAHIYFEVAFAVVLVSLLVQGWTVAPVARALGVELPRLPEPPARIDLDLPGAGERDLVVYTVKPSSPVARQGLRRRLLLEKSAFVSVIRDGKALDARWIDQLEPGDSVLVIAPPERLAVMDRLFTRPVEGGRETEIFGEFTLDGQAPAAEIAALYDFPIPDEAKTMTLGEFVAGRLARRPVAGDRVRVGDVELIVREVEDGRITRIGIELEPITRAWLPVAQVRTWLNAWTAPVRRLLARFRIRPRTEQREA